MDLNVNELARIQLTSFVSEVISTGNSDIIAMGLVPADFDTNRAPGWEKKSIAYHTDDGG